MSPSITSPTGVLSDFAVIGARTIGNGIAQVCAQSGRQAALVDLSEGLPQRRLFAERAHIWVPETILASNTSSVSITPLGAAGHLGRKTGRGFYEY